MIFLKSQNYGNAGFFGVARIWCFGFFLSLVHYATFAEAAEESQALRWANRVEYGAQVGFEDSIAKVQLLIPALSRDRSIAFMAFGGNMFDGASLQTATFDFGVRLMREQQDIVGLYGAIEVESNKYNNAMNRFVIGGEWFDESFDAHLNVYFAENILLKREDLSPDFSLIDAENGTQELLTRTYSERLLPGVHGELGVRGNFGSGQIHSSAGAFYFKCSDDGYDCPKRYGGIAKVDFLSPALVINGLKNESLALTAGIHGIYDSVRGTELAGVLKVTFEFGGQRTAERSDLASRMIDFPVRYVQANAVLCSEVTSTTIANPFENFFMIADASDGFLQEILYRAGEDIVVILDNSAGDFFAIGSDLFVLPGQTIISFDLASELFPEFGITRVASAEVVESSGSVSEVEPDALSSTSSPEMRPMTLSLSTEDAPALLSSETAQLEGMGIEVENASPEAAYIRLFDGAVIHGANRTKYYDLVFTDDTQSTGQFLLDGITDVEFYRTTQDFQMDIQNTSNVSLQEVTFLGVENSDSAKETALAMKKKSSDISVRNLSVSGFKNGVNIFGSTKNVSLQDVTIDQGAYSNPRHGIKMQNSDNITVENMVITGAFDTGMRVREKNIALPTINIRGLVVDGAATGLYFKDANFDGVLTIESSRFENIQESMIELEDSAIRNITLKDAWISNVDNMVYVKNGSTLKQLHLTNTLGPDQAKIENIGTLYQSTEGVEEFIVTNVVIEGLTGPLFTVSGPIASGVSMALTGNTISDVQSDFITFDYSSSSVPQPSADTVMMFLSDNSISATGTALDLVTFSDPQSLSGLCYDMVLKDNTLINGFSGLLNAVGINSCTITLENNTVTNADFILKFVDPVALGDMTLSDNVIDVLEDAIQVIYTSP